MTTQAIITDKNNTVVVTSKQPTVVIAGMIGPQTVTTGVGQLSDVDTTQLNPGSVLVYNSGTSKWTSTTILELQTIEAGQY